jgi:hypothetical protein
LSWRSSAEPPFINLDGEIARFATDELRADPALRLPVIEERYGALWEEMLAVLGFSEDERAE